MRNLILSLWYKWKEYRYTQKCIKHLGIRPQKMYVSKEQYDALIAAINAPPDPERIAKTRKILERKAPWDETNESSK